MRVLKGTPLSSLRIGGGGGPEGGLVELEGGVLKELTLNFFEDPPRATPGEGETGLFPLDSLEEGIPLGEREGESPPPRPPPEWLRKSLPNMTLKPNAVMNKNE
ncbi:UNVERIFIED_CONTAM: hypothetical protein Slati_1420200 [Sesamum latifolium]|uniref:Uncharacterized protein n=1 Tax=Sesamum latifolium TaxID=2727402 RepID=A0AAW2X498_9LAMI